MSWLDGLFAGSVALLLPVLFYDVRSFLQLRRLILTQPHKSKPQDQTRQTAASVDIVIAVYNMGETFRRTLSSIERSDYPAKRLTVVDDGSDDGITPQILDSLQDRIDRLSHLPHGGKAIAANYGAAQGDADIIIFVDADSYVTADFIEVALSELEQNSAIEAIDFVPQVANPQDSIWTRIAAFERALLMLAPDNFGALFVIRRSTFERLQFRPGSAPQFDLNQRLLQSGSLRTGTQKIVWSDEPAMFSRMYRRKRRWLYGMLETCRAHGRSPGIMLALPFVDLYLLGTGLLAVFDAKFLLIPGLLLAVWLLKALLLLKLLGFSLCLSGAYVGYMIMLMVAFAEAVIRFRVGSKVPWI